MKTLQISAKTLGQLALPGFCDRCFWIRLNCPTQPPWQTFPGIFSSLDSYGKRITGLHFAKHRRPLPWIVAKIGHGAKPIDVPHWSKFCISDWKTGVKLTGVPDELWRRRDKSLAIVDAKTARYTEGQDELLPLYAVQINCYARIADGLGMGEASWAGLEYYEPITDIKIGTLSEVVKAQALYMRFQPKLIDVSLNPLMVTPLLEKARNLFDLESPPSGAKGCKNCERVDALVRTVNLAQRGDKKGVFS
jgi:hypothetical protein